MTNETIAIRPAAADEERTLLRLAALDSAAALHGDVIVAVVDGEILAAQSLADGRTIADPFRRTADLTELLRTRSRLLGEHATPRRRPSLRRPAPVALAR
jgi:hypothetical protein